MLKDRITPPKGIFFPLKENIANNFTSSRKKAGERHVPLVIPIFPGGGPISPRYKMMSPLEKFTSPKDMVGNKPVFSKGRVVEMERHVRCIILPRVSPSPRWHVVQNKKVSQRLSKTQKKRMHRPRGVDKR